MSESDDEYMPCPSCGREDRFYMLIIGTEPCYVRRDGEYDWPDSLDTSYAYALACDCGWRMGGEDPPQPPPEMNFAKELVKEHANKVRELFLKELETDDA